MPRAVALAAGFHLIVLGGDTAATPPHSAHGFITTTFGISGDDLRRIDGGEVFTQTLDASDDREVAILGIVRAAITPQFYAARLTDVARFKQGDAILQIGTFGTPARVDDVQALSFEPWELRSLPRCRAGSCGLQLGGAEMSRFADAPSRAPSAEQRLNERMQRVLLDSVERYRRSGRGGLMVYADDSTVVNVATEFDDLAATDALLARFGPLRQYLLTFPLAASSPVKELIYWSKEKLGRTPVVSMTHLVISSPDHPAVAYAIASKQIYASHYFDASLGLTILVRDRESATPATYVIYRNRSRVDAFDGLFGGIIRGIVRSRARSALTDNLQVLRERLEREFVEGGTDES